MVKFWMALLSGGEDIEKAIILFDITETRLRSADSQEPTMCIFLKHAIDFSVYKMIEWS